MVTSSHSREMITICWLLVAGRWNTFSDCNRTPGPCCRRSVHDAKVNLCVPYTSDLDHCCGDGDDDDRVLRRLRRSRNRSGASSGVAIAKSHEPSARSGERAAGNDRVSTSGPTAPSTAGAPPGPGDEESPEAGGGGAGLGNNGRKSIPKKFTQRPQRGLKASPAYMSFDDVDVEGQGSPGVLLCCAVPYAVMWCGVSSLLTSNLSSHFGLCVDNARMKYSGGVSFSACMAFVEHKSCEMCLFSRYCSHESI